MARLCSLICLLAASLPAQGQAALKMVDGHPLIRASLRSGSQTYEGHLLLDLSLPSDLVLHPRAANALPGPVVELVSGGVHLRGLEVQSREDPWLEEMSARHARALQEIPIVGMLGISALAPHTVILDGPRGQLWLLPAAGNVRPLPTDRRFVVDLYVAPRTGGVQVPVELGDGTIRPFGLDTRRAYSRMDPDLLRTLGLENGRLDRARLGGLELAGITPFRPASVPLGRAGTIGARVLRQMVLTLQPTQEWLALERRQPLPFPEDEAAYYALDQGRDRVADLGAFLRTWPESTYTVDGARELFALGLAAHDLELVGQAAGVAFQGAEEGRRGREALDLLARLPEGEDWLAVREEIASAALTLARAERDLDARHALNLQLGILAQLRGDHREARRQLLSAVFAKPRAGPANLALGRLYAEMGQPERARSRYFLAMLARATRAEAFGALQQVHGQIAPSADLVETLEEMAEGRVPALHPLPREQAGLLPPGRVVLVEMFTGAHSPASVAADLAFDALGELYSDQEIALVRWHLPLPAATPLVAEVAMDRAGQVQVSGPPVVRFGGTLSMGDGGGQEQSEALLRSYRKVLDQALSTPPTAEITARAWLDGDRVHLAARVSGETQTLRLHAVLVERTLVFPGQNDLLFHRQVARAGFTPTAGVSTGEPYATSLDLQQLAAQLEATFEGLMEQRATPLTPPIPSPNNLGVVLFLENPSDRSIPQALSIPVVPRAKTP